MKKHFIVLLSMVMCFALVFGIFAACGTETTAPQKYTISFYDDETLVDTIETAGNEKIGLPMRRIKKGLRSRGGILTKAHGTTGLQRTGLPKRH